MTPLFNFLLKLGVGKHTKDLMQHPFVFHLYSVLCKEQLL